MQFVIGDNELKIVSNALATATLPFVEINPEARKGEPLTLIQVSVGNNCWPIVVADTPAVLTLFMDTSILAAFAAEEVAAALVNHGFSLPERWACLRMTERLLSGNHTLAATRAELFARYPALTTKHRAQHKPKHSPEKNTDNSIPMGDNDQEQLMLHPAILRSILKAQMQQIVKRKMIQVSKLEAATFTPIAHMQNDGFPIDKAGWQHQMSLYQQEQESLFQPMATQLNVALSTAQKLLSDDRSLLKQLKQCGYTLVNLQKESVLKLPENIKQPLQRSRILRKLLDSYGDKIIQQVRNDNRLHPTFVQLGASTGRMACHSPNMQAITKDPNLRQHLRAPKGRTLIILDYATCELRILADMSGDPVFCKAFLQGDDLHAIVATQIYGRKVSKLDFPELRDQAKAISFGLIYGMGTAALSRTLQISEQAAKKLFADYFHRFPTILQYLDNSVQRALALGYAVTLSGRRLYLEPNNNANARIAKNMPIQGTSADITKIALSRVYKLLKKHFASAHMVHVVHDEIIIEADIQAAETIALRTADEMEKAGAELLTKVPMRVDWQVTEAWMK